MIIQSALRAGRLAVSSLLLLSFTAAGAEIACTLTPLRSTNNVGAVHTVTARVTGTNGAALAGVTIEFDITSGPNAPLSQTSVTDGGGNTTFTYTSDGSAGTDIIRATGLVGTNAFTCLATQIWIVAGSAPSIACPGNIVTNAAGASCSRSVAFGSSIVVSGSPMPSRQCRIGADVINNSSHQFPVGVTTVTCVASNANGTASCSFNVAVNENDPAENPPQLQNCPQDSFVAAIPGSGQAEVHYETPTATDNCGEPAVVCAPASGSVLPVGVTSITCTATDVSGNTNSCTFNVTVEEVTPETHDLAIVRIRAPRVVTLTEARPVVTKRVVVTIQNRSPHAEAFFDSSQLANLVGLTVGSFDSATCADITPVFLERPPQRRLPFNLRPRQKLNVYFEVTFDGCAVNPARGPGAEDFFYTAQVYHEAIDGNFDTHPECDVCPRPPLEGGFDPNPNGRIRDRGCGAPAGRGTFGNDVLTDVVFR